MNSKSSKGTRTTLRRNAVAQACVTFSMLLAASTQIAVAGPGFVDATGVNGDTKRIPTFFAYSPSGMRDTAVPEEILLAPAQGRPDGANFTGVPLRKFVDPLPLAGKANKKLMADGTEKYIPVAVASNWINPQGVTVTGQDYYELGIVEYTDRFHSDLTKATTLRGYVQIDHLASNGHGRLPGSDAVPLFYPDTKDALGNTVAGAPIMIAATDIRGKLTGGPKVQALAVDKPHFLGPVIAATKDRPTRLKVLNLLPVGRALFTEGTKDAIDPLNGDLTTVPTFDVTNRRGDLFLPVDKSILGAGIGPDGMTEYTQNRASVHLHGGDTPWISDGTPHQWITPAGENDANVPGSLAADFNNVNGTLDPAMLSHFVKGASTANVPDMNDPGDGAMTMYFPNGQSARVLWYHDHTFGATRLNVYAGMASAYLLTDTVEQGLVNSKALPPAERTIPMVLQDRTFVPDDIGLQDARWNTTAWGQPGDSWFPHVYETVQDPAQANNWNAVGRWHYGPWFWPVFPALYTLPEGTYSPAGYENSVTTTPEGWNDTPIINGVAYPTLEVEPTTYRFRLLNASNDRMMTFNLFLAKATATLADGTVVENTGNLEPIPGTDPEEFRPRETEIDMVPAAAVLAGDLCAPDERRPTPIGDTGKYCIPDTWPTDGRLGGIPNPAGVGPTIYQIASEGGWLPKVAKYEPAPINYITDKGRIVVLNVDYGKSGLFIAPAERADVVIDFSEYAGKTLLVYNDSGAPVPAGDPRNDTFTGVGDQAGSGGAEDTKPGFGPNTRTMMQIKVKAMEPDRSFSPVALDEAIQGAYFSDPERRPVVAQDIYSGFNKDWAKMSPTEMYGDIYLGSLKNPTFQFTPGTPSSGVANVKVTATGAGYIDAPKVTIAAPAAGGQAATAVATMKMDAVNVVNRGKGYTSAPLVSFAGGGGSGAVALATVRVDTASAKVTAAGANYNPPSGQLRLAFTTPPAATTKTPAGVAPTGYATVDPITKKVTGITILTPGSGYSTVPTVTIQNRDYLDGTLISGSGAKATLTGELDAVIIHGTDPALNAATSGGGGYTDMGAVQVTLTGGLSTVAGVTTAAASATATGKLFDITLTHPGSGYASGEEPAVTMTTRRGPTTAATVKATASATAGAKESYLVKTKAIQELFDPTYGRLNATLGVELPFTSALTQTTIPLGYVDEATEKFADGETQIWKITHNGVDSHPVHFHLLNVQVINRVGWDGFIQPIEPREAGWKETVTMSPLEDVIVAVRAKKPTLPGFGVPLSVRMMDPTQPEGSPFGFTQIDPTTGNPKVVTNAMVDYGWEYVWHCHILGHEENDFMRPITFNANEAVPTAPALSLVSTNGTSASFTFTDNSTTEHKFSIRRAPVAANGAVGAYAEIGTELALSAPTTGSSFVDATLAPEQGYLYTVAAVGASGEGLSNVVSVSTFAAPPAPALLAETNLLNTNVALTWSIPGGTTVGGYTITRTDTAGVVATFTAAAADVALTDVTAAGNTTYTYVITAINGDKQTASNTVTVTTPNLNLATPDGLATQPNATRIRVTWQDRSVGETRFSVQRTTDGINWVQLGVVTSGTQVAATGTNYQYDNQRNTGTNRIQPGVTYTYRVVAEQVVNGAVVKTSDPSATVTVVYATAGAVTNLATTNVVRNSPTSTTERVSFSWTPNATVGALPITSAQVQWARNVGFTQGANQGTLGTLTATSGTATNVPRGLPTPLFFRVRMVNALGNGTWSTPIGPIAMP